MSWLSKAIRKANDFIAKVDPLAKNLPEFQQQKKAFEAGNWDDPYGSEASGWDFLGAGPGAQITSGGKPILGQLDPENPEDRAKGRAIGTAIADYWTLGLFSQVVKPKGNVMQLESDGGRLAFGSLTSPGTLTQQFSADASSVTPQQAQIAESFDSLKRWTWYGVIIIAVVFFLTRKGLLK